MSETLRPSRNCIAVYKSDIIEQPGEESSQSSHKTKKEQAPSRDQVLHLLTEVSAHVQ
jgi:hypothetical protein